MTEQLMDYFGDSVGLGDDDAVSNLNFELKSGESDDGKQELEVNLLYQYPPTLRVKVPGLENTA